MLGFGRLGLDCSMVWAPIGRLSADNDSDYLFDRAKRTWSAVRSDPPRISVEDGGVKFRIGNFDLVVELRRGFALSLGYPTELVPGIARRWLPRFETKDLCTVWVDLLERSRQIEQQGSRGFDRIVPSLLDCEDCQTSFQNGRQLLGDVEHVVVGRDETCVTELMEGNQHLPIHEFSESLVYPTNRNEADIHEEFCQAVQNRYWEVVVDRKIHLSRQLMLQVDRFLD